MYVLLIYVFVKVNGVDFQKIVFTVPISRPIVNVAPIPAVPKYIRNGALLHIRFYCIAAF